MTRSVDSKCALGIIFPIFITSHDIDSVTKIPYKLCTVRLLNLLCVCVDEETDKHYRLFLIYMHIINYIECTYICIFSKTSLNRPTMGPTLGGSFKEVIGLGS